MRFGASLSTIPILLVGISHENYLRKRRLGSDLSQEPQPQIPSTVEDLTGTKHGPALSRNIERVYRVLSKPDFPVRRLKSKAHDMPSSALLPRKCPLLGARI
jgi:hypothetical protein